MSPRLPGTCFATLLFLADLPSATDGFRLGPVSHMRHRSARIRSRSSCSHQTRSISATSSDKLEDDAGHGLVPPPERRLVRDSIDDSGVYSAVQKLKVPAASRLRKAGFSLDENQPGLVAETLLTFRRLLVSGNVSKATRMLMSAVHDLGACSPGNSDSTHSHTGAIVDWNANSVRTGFTDVLLTCANRGFWREANEILMSLMPTAGVEASGADWLLAIDACAGAGGSEQAVFHLHNMRMRPSRGPNVCKHCSSSNNNSSSHPRPHRGLEINRSVYGAAVRACACSGDTGRALFLLKEATKRGTPLLPADIAGGMRAATAKQVAGWRQSLALFETFMELALGQARLRSAPERGGGVAGPIDDEDQDVPGPLRGNGRQLQLLSEVVPGWEGVCQAALEACTRGRQWERALEILNVLRAGGGGTGLSREAYDEAIEVCGDAGQWDMVLLLVAEMRSDEVPISPAAFETALKGCAATGSWSWARLLLSSMFADEKDGVPLTAEHYLEALRACAAVVDKPGGSQAQAAAKAALQLLQDFREARWLAGNQGESAYMCAMDACVAAQDAWSALALLDSAQDDRVWRSIALRTSAMQACSGAGEWRAALCILGDMQEEGLRPSGAAYVAAMAACARGGVVDLALELLDKVLEEHPGDEKTITAGYHGAIAACAECGHWEGATSLLQKMRRDSLAVVTSKEYNSAILACCRAQQSVAALTILGDMSLEGAATQKDGDTTGRGSIRPDETSYIHVMRAFGKDRRWRTVLDLLGSMKEEAGLVPTVSSYNVVVEALSKAGEWKRALGALADMKREGVRPTEFTYNRCMAACERSGQWEQTLSLMTDMKLQEDLVPDSYMCSTAMMACSKAGRLDDVLGILQEMREMPGGKGPNLVNYNIAIGSCARARDWTRMMEEIDNMRWEDIDPEESTFFVPLDMCGRSGELSMARTLLARMKEYNVEPGVVTYGSAVAAACGAGDAAYAALLLDEMEAAGHPPNEVTYGVASLACRNGANADAAVDLIRRRERQGLPPDPLVVSLAVQACARAGDFERGLQLIADVKSAGFVTDSSFYNSVIAGISASFSPARVESGQVQDDEQQQQHPEAL